MVPGMTERERRIADAGRRDWLREMALPPGVWTAPRRRVLRPAEIVRFAAARRVVAAIRCQRVALDGPTWQPEPRP